jgi:hypothetical protein
VRRTTEPTEVIAMHPQSILIPLAALAASALPIGCGQPFDGGALKSDALAVSSGDTPLLSQANVTAYSFYSFPSNTTYHDQTIVLEVTTDPGNVSGHQRFFAYQFFQEGGQGGYVGLQDYGCADPTTTCTRTCSSPCSNGCASSPQKIAIFSIWGATGCVSNTPGAHCVNFCETGPGWSAHIPFNWSANRKYKLTVANMGGPNWGGAVEDLTTGVTTGIGVLSVPATVGHLTSNPDAFTEYFGPDFASCSDLGKSVVDFWQPKANTGTVGGSWYKDTVPTGSCMSDRHSTGSDPAVQTVGQ